MYIFKHLFDMVSGFIKGRICDCIMAVILSACSLHSDYA